MVKPKVKKLEVTIEMMKFLGDQVYINIHFGLMSP